MSSADCLRKFGKKRPTAADEEIFRPLKSTDVKYEEGIDHQRGLLGIIWIPELKTHRIDCPQSYVCKEEEVPADQQLCDQEMKSSLTQEDLEPLQVKKEEEELHISQEGEQLVLKQETDSFMLTPTYEENDYSEDQTLFMKHEESAEENDSEVKMPVISSVVGAANNDQLLLSSSSQVSVSHDKGGERGGEGVEFEPKSQSLCRKNTGEEPFYHETCGKHVRHHHHHLTEHMRIHTGEKPYICKTCGKQFRGNHHLTKHLRIHMEEKPFICETCRKHFRHRHHLTEHMRIHTGEKPYRCKTCGKHFRRSHHLTKHMRIHTEEKPLNCKTCGKHFRLGNLTVHMEIHSG